MTTITRAGLVRLGSLILLGLYLSLSSLPEHAHARPVLDRREFLQLLRQDNLDELEAQLQKYVDDYRAGKISDHIVEQAYYSFGSADPDLESKLNEWIADRPGSYSARIARGLFYMNLGWISRGYAWAQKTADVRFAVMRNYVGLARSDFTAALEINSRFGLAYGSLIQIAMMLGESDEADFLVRKGLEADPRSFVIRRRYLFSLVPWWRINSPQPQALSSFESRMRDWRLEHGQVEVPENIRDFVTEIEGDAADNPALEPLKGFNDYVIAELLSRQDRREEAIKYYDSALRFGDYWWYHQEQGYNYFRLDRFDDAVKSYTRALEAWPQFPDSLDWRARNLRKLGQFDRAFADWNEALSVDPRNPRILVQKAYALREVKRYQDVLSTLDQATLYGAYDEDIRDARGRILLYELERPADAIDDLRRATKLDPESKRYWYNYGLALYRTKDCKAAEALSTYRRVCIQGAECSKKNMKWAAEVIAYMEHSRNCPPR